MNFMLGLINRPSQDPEMGGKRGDSAQGCPAWADVCNLEIAVQAILRHP